MRRGLTALATVAVLATLPAVAHAASPWSLTVSPQTATQGQSTSFSLTLTNNTSGNSNRLGCLEVDLPASFVNISVNNSSSDPNSNNNSNGDWDAVVVGNTVVVDADPGGGLLEQGKWVTFTITARPTAAGSSAWSNDAHTSQQADPNCHGTEPTGTPLQVTVTGSATPTPVPTPIPTPVPTLIPTPVPTPIPTPVPTPVVTPKPIATPVPTRTPASTPFSGASVPPITESPTPTAEPTVTPEASNSERPSTPAPAPTPAGTGTGGSSGLRMAPLSDSTDGATNDLGTGLDILAMLDGPFVWFVPGAAVGVPGLLVIAFVALQGVGVLAWIPAVRRLGGDDRNNRLRPL